MEIVEIVKRNYAAAERRKQISNKSTVSDFLAKTDEEVQELKESRKSSSIYPFDPKEAVDVILVQFTMLHHYGFDVEKLIVEKMMYNEIRP